MYSSGHLLKAVMIILITKKQSESSSRSPGEEHRDASHVVFTLLPTALQPTLVRCTIIQPTVVLHSIQTILVLLCSIQPTLVLLCSIQSTLTQVEDPSYTSLNHLTHYDTIGFNPL